MSAIDQYKHKQLGLIECPSTYDFVYSNATRDICIYQLLEDVPVDEESFDGKKGDIIVGGGSGEAPAFRISFPSAFYFFTSEQWDEFENYDELFKHFWTPTQSYIFCEGFSKIGWTVDRQIEMWLTENIIRIMINEVAEYRTFQVDKIEAKPKLKFRLALLK